MSNEDLELRVKAAEEKADHAAEVAMASIASMRSLHDALERSHQQMGDMLIASKQISKLAEHLAGFVLRSNIKKD